jgi:Ca2+-binding RTX toxin-like protein
MGPRKKFLDGLQKGHDATLAGVSSHDLGLMALGRSEERGMIEPRAGFDHDCYLSEFTFLFGGPSHDALIGNSGSDLILGGGARDDLAGHAGADILIGNQGRDRIDGGAGGDALFGGDGRDRISGKRGNDWIEGGAGGDRLLGGAGNDTLAGGQGKDKFVFTDGAGRDRITDFQDGLDRIVFKGHDLVGGIDDLAIFDVEGGAKVVFGPQWILVEGVDADELSAGDFIF